MMRVLCALLATLAVPAMAMDQMQMEDMNDDAYYTHVEIDQLEWQAASQSSALSYQIQGSTGNDEHKFLLQSEGDVDHGLNGARHELLYAQPINDYFDWRAGVMGNYGSNSASTSVAAGISGLAPYGINTTAEAYVSTRGKVAGKIELSTDVLITNRLILTPDAEVYGGVYHDLSAGIRLRYEIKRGLAPYIGVVYRNESGTSPAHGVRFVAGLRFWY